MKIKSAEFKLSAPNLESCPKSALPEFAFIGRSNVGKSSLINLLVERKDFAKVSDTPGKTKLINFFLLNNKWHLVDLPGYGYAEVARKEHADFARAVTDYLEHRTNLACVFVLIDSRLPPQKIDLEFINWLATCGVAFVLVFSKIDKLSATQLQANIALFQQRMLEAFTDLPQIFTSSAKTKNGRTEILNFIEQTLIANNHA